MLLILAVMKRWRGFLQDCRDLWQEKKRSLLLLAAASIISINWLTYIWAVNHNHVLDTSLGYYINPLMSLLLGVVIFNEKLSQLKCISIALAFTGILLMTWQLGTLPWVAVVLATTFSADIIHLWSQFPTPKRTGLYTVYQPQHSTISRPLFLP